MGKNLHPRITLTLLSFMFALQLYSQEKLSVTIYNNNLGVVKEQRELDLKKGNNQIFIENIPSSIITNTVFAKIDNASIEEQNYRYDLASFDKILNKYIGKDISVMSETGKTISGTLISSNGSQLVIKSKTGELTMIPDYNKYTINTDKLPEGLILKPTLQWSVFSESQGKRNLNFNYQTSGLTWNAQYVGELDKDEKYIDVKAWVSINNTSGANFENAKVRLIAGEVNKAVERSSNYDDEVRMFAVSSNKQKMSIKEETFFEYHLYDISKYLNLLEREEKQISLFEYFKVPVTKDLVIYGDRMNVNSTEDINAEVKIRFKNSIENNAGKPMPKGAMLINKNDGSKVEYIGDDFIKHKSKDDIIELRLGEAYDVKASSKLLESVDLKKGQKNLYEVTFKNRKDEDVEVIYKKSANGNWEITENTLNFEKENANLVLFRVKVKANSETVLKFQLKETWKY